MVSKTAKLARAARIGVLSLVVEESLRPQPGRSIMTVQHDRLNCMSDARSPLPLDRVEEIGQCRHRDRGAAVRSDDDRKVPPLNPSVQRGMTDAEHTSRKGAGDRLSKILFEIGAHSPEIAVPRGPALGAAQVRNMLEEPFAVFSLHSINLYRSLASTLKSVTLGLGSPSNDLGNRSRHRD